MKLLSHRVIVTPLLRRRIGWPYHRPSPLGSRLSLGPPLQKLLGTANPWLVRVFEDVLVQPRSYPCHLLSNRPQVL